MIIYSNCQNVTYKREKSMMKQQYIKVWFITSKARSDF